MKLIPTIIILAAIAVLLTRVIQLKSNVRLLEGQLSAMQDQNQQLKESQNVMVWKMDDSCFDQIKNSMDGTLQLKISK